jgi:hypothetical protein
LPQNDWRGLKHVVYHYILIKNIVVLNEKSDYLLHKPGKLAFYFMLIRPNKHNIRSAGNPQLLPIIHP